MDSETENGPPQNLFFTGSDDDDASMETSEQAQPGPSKPKLFFTDSEDEDQMPASSFVTPKKRSISIHDEKEDTSSEVEIPSFEDIPRASSVSSKRSSASSRKDKDSSPSPSIECVERPIKKRRVTPAASQAPFKSIYLGSFIVGNAWSTVKGKGYIKSGDGIQVEREDQDVDSSIKETAANKKGKTTAKGKTKQLSIATMMRAPPPKTSKKKANTVVRLTNSRGFGMFFLHCTLDGGDISV